MNDAPAGETIEQRKARIAALRRLNAVLPKEQRRSIPPLRDAAPQPGRESSDEAVDLLLAMSRADYTNRVCSDLSADKDDRWTLYLDPRLIQLTHSVLLRKQASVARLTSETRESAASPVARRRWAFKEKLEYRIQQAEAALPDAVLTSDRSTVRRLFAAIQAHRRAVTSNGQPPEEWDLKLWQTVDGLSLGDQTD